jgi:hypothetical protein
VPVKGIAFQVPGASKQRRETLAVNHLGIIWPEGCDFHEGGIEIVGDNGFIANGARLDFARPADDAGDTEMVRRRMEAKAAKTRPGKLRAFMLSE